MNLRVGENKVVLHNCSEMSKVDIVLTQSLLTFFLKKAN